MKFGDLYVGLQLYVDGEFTTVLRIDSHRVAFSVTVSRLLSGSFTNDYWDAHYASRCTTSEAYEIW